MSSGLGVRRQLNNLSSDLTISMVGNPTEAAGIERPARQVATRTFLHPDAVSPAIMLLVGTACVTAQVAKRFFARPLPAPHRSGRLAAKAGKVSDGGFLVARSVARAPARARDQRVNVNPFPAPRGARRRIAHGKAERR